MATRVQWVNLPGSGVPRRDRFLGDGVAKLSSMGRKVKIEVTFDKKQPPGTATLTLTPKGTNATYAADGTADNGFGEALLEAQVGAAPTARIGRDGKATFEVLLSAAGGDGWDVSASDGVTTKTLDSIETRRRFYYQVVGMKGVGQGTHPDEGLDGYGFLETEYNKGRRGIELKAVKAKGVMKNVAYLADNEGADAAVLAALKENYNPCRDPYCVGILWADRCVDINVVALRSAASASRGGAAVQLTAGTALWIDPDEGADGNSWFVSAHLEVQETAPLRTVKHAIAAGDVHRVDGTHVRVDTANLPAGKTGKIVVTVRTSDGFDCGSSWPGTNILMLATRVGNDRRAEEDLKKTVIHEVAHKFGMVPNGKTTKSRKPLKKQSNFDGASTTGPHCVQPAPNPATCVMYKTAHPAKTKEFCGPCGESLRKMSLDPQDLVFRVVS